MRRGLESFLYVGTKRNAIGDTREDTGLSAATPLSSSTIKRQWKR